MAAVPSGKSTSVATACVTTVLRAAASLTTTVRVAALKRGGVSFTSPTTMVIDLVTMLLGSDGLKAATVRVYFAVFSLSRSFARESLPVKVSSANTSVPVEELSTKRKLISSRTSLSVASTCVTSKPICSFSMTIKISAPLANSGKLSFLSVTVSATETVSDRPISPSVMTNSRARILFAPRPSRSIPPATEKTFPLPSTVTYWLPFVTA